MRLMFTRPTLVGPTSYGAGEAAEVPDGLAHRHVKSGSAVPAPEAFECGPAETAAAPAAPESADATPGARRKVK